ncbi:hypothetical protein [Hahella ganghwensis]|uniref:hypothetical protein n=1 Tax=Hahella ganghwensis TaxID=286420 RepID=UPI00036D7AD8|nr:hypothetical protein [Hahella ganghwensis]
MPDQGQDMIQALLRKQKLLDINNCPAVPVEVSKAIYGVTQDDTGDGIKFTKSTVKKRIDPSVIFEGNSYTAVWHFMLENPVHHFVVVPWYQHTTPEQGQFYTVLMAWENKYTLNQYINGTNGAPTGAKGYKAKWTAEQVSDLVYDLLKGGRDAIVDYCGQAGAWDQNKETQLTLWKYKKVLLTTAAENVATY